MGMIIVVLSGFALALVAPWLHRAARGAAGWLLALLPAGLAVYFAALIGAIAGGDTLVITYPWAPGLGVSLSFYVDGLSLLFALLISGIGALVVIYAGSYLKGKPTLGRFYTLVLMFMASMLGVVLAGNIITLFVFWELTSLTSYLLIGLDHDRPTARAAALQALLVTGGGGLALLAGLLLLGQAGGSLELAALLNNGAALGEHALYLPIVLLILLGAFTKSAQFPFHFWLPNAMEAPTPVSAYLHSATMVKAGVYLLARLSPVLGGTDAWHYLVTGAGMATMLLGALLALAQTDLKRILAYSTVSTLGTLVLLLGLDTTLSVKAAMLFLLVHALYKGALFLAAGAVDHETGTRDIGRLGGLARAMPITAAAAGLAALSMAGLPPMLGFINKELLYEAKLQAPRAAALITAAGVAANMLLVAVAGLVGLGPFWGRRHVPGTSEVPGTSGGKKPHEAPLAMWLGPAVLAGLGLLNGLFPEALPSTLVAAAASAVRGQPTEVKLALWHGINPILALSVLTVAVGAGIYAGHAALRRAVGRFAPGLSAVFRNAGRWGPQAGYDLALRGLNGVARAQTRFLQSGYLSAYLIIIILTTVGLAGYALAARGGVQLALSVVEGAAGGATGIRLYEALVGLLILAATLLAVFSSARLTAVAALGVVGYGVALIYTLFGAPDLAMTQFAIETLTVFLFVLVLYRLPRFASLSRRATRVRDAAIALAAGGLMTVLVLVATAMPLDSRLSPYFAENAASLARGRNIVNVILVDFRGLDTLGEITVLAAAAIGVYALLKLRLDE
jgi:multicomponent Na+:H+ antiporter subunit A